MFGQWQPQLFPRLAEELGALSALDRQFSEALARADLGRFTRPYPWCGNGAPPHARVWLLHAFLAKSIYQFPTTAALRKARQSDGKTYRFLVDTGSSTTLASRALGQRRRSRARSAHAPHAARRRHRLRTRACARHRVRRSLRPPRLADRRRDGFPVFRNTLLALDYPRSRLGIAPYPAVPPPVLKQSPRISTIAFNNERNSPLIPIQMGNESFIVLIDSGSDGSLTLNPVGLHPKFANGPRVGRLAQNILVGSHTLAQPIADLTDELSSLGGEMLRNFSLTFDQRRNQVTFTRDADGPVRLTPRRSLGLSFGRSRLLARARRRARGAGVAAQHPRPAISSCASTAKPSRNGTTSATRNS